MDYFKKLKFDIFDIKLIFDINGFSIGTNNSFLVCRHSWSTI